MSNEHKSFENHLRSHFEAHLAHVSKVVKTWPTWKQGLLGGNAVEPPKRTIRQVVDAITAGDHTSEEETRRAVVLLNRMMQQVQFDMDRLIASVTNDCEPGPTTRDLIDSMKNRKQATDKLLSAEP